MKTINDYTIYCTEEQTKKALELGASIDKNILEHTWLGKPVIEITESSKLKSVTSYYVCPTAEQMIGWLEEQNIQSIEILYDVKWGYEVFNKKYTYLAHKCEYNSRKEATLAAIDAALEYLANNKK